MCSFSHRPRRRDSVQFKLGEKDSFMVFNSWFVIFVLLTARQKQTRDTASHLLAIFVMVGAVARIAWLFIAAL